MVFSSPLFLFLFLPVALTVYALVPWTKARNYWLLGMSLVFYAWGEVGFILLLLGSVLANWGLGLWVEQGQSVQSRQLGLTLAVVVNIGLLAFFKYANFAAGLVNGALKSLHVAPIPESHIPLPIGISFFTFHALSYVIDIYRRKWKSAANPLDLALYIFFFPQLVAGPILRWSAIGPQLSRRPFNSDNFAEGVRRFIGGLGKKCSLPTLWLFPPTGSFH